MVAYVSIPLKPGGAPSRSFPGPLVQLSLLLVEAAQADEAEGLMSALQGALWRTIPMIPVLLDMLSAMNIKTTTMGRTSKLRVS